MSRRSRTFEMTRRNDKKTKTSPSSGVCEVTATKALCPSDK